MSAGRPGNVRRWVMLCTFILMGGAACGDAVTEPAKGSGPAADLLAEGPRLQPGSGASPAASARPIKPVQAALEVGERGQVLQACAGGGMRFRLPEAGLSHDFTLELWFRVDEGRDQRVFSSGSLALDVHRGRVRARLGGASLVGAAVAPRDWYHVAVVVQGSVARLYVGGGLVDQTAFRGRWTRPHGEAHVGGVAEDAAAFCGALDNLRLTAEPLHLDGFLPELDLRVTDSTLAGFNFDLDAAPEVQDLSGLDHHGTLYGRAALTPGRI
ncbi:MAG: LamG domain-containing protein [Deltaproteobacteria bacterium]|nr:LamG domain-containing protein [Deltaproteobacteria bacterium]